MDTAALAIATLLIAVSGLVVAYYNLQTSRLSAIVSSLAAVHASEVSTLQEINKAQAAKVDELQARIDRLTERVDILERENTRLMADLIKALAERKP